MTPGLVPAELAEQAVASRPAVAVKVIAINA
jgi:hypothetical protein